MQPASVRLFRTFLDGILIPFLLRLVADRFTVLACRHGDPTNVATMGALAVNLVESMPF
jgi:hypothetical protein